jgi:hypothetical protein
LAVLIPQTVRSDDPILAQEGRIKWLAPIRGRPFLRQGIAYAGSPTARPRIAGATVIGHAVNCRGRWPTFASGVFATRCFYVKPGDEKPDPDGYLPVDAVSPYSIAPGLPSRRPGDRLAAHALMFTA